MKKTSFNKDWTFSLGGRSVFEEMMGASGDVEKVTLPHDASIRRERNPEEPNGSGNGFFREENYVYAKTFTLNPEDEGKNIWIEFEGVYQNAFVYINNSFAGKHPYGYGNFYIDATRLVKFGEENKITVQVKNGVPSGRWYTGGGIYRDVNLMIADRLHLVPDGIHLAAIDVEEDQAVIRSRAAVEYTGTGVRDIQLMIKLYDAEGALAAEDVMPITVEEHSKRTFTQKIYVHNPKLWSTDTPYLYKYKCIVLENGMEIDAEEGTFGIRKLQLDPKHGLRINGKEVKLRGGCIHHDNGITGTAEFPHAAEFRVKRLKEAGYNAIRSSHYPMSRRLLEVCDREGMLVMDEFADVWTTTKVDFDYGMHMTEWWEQDVTNLINKDYNHPCVIMYSIGNEIPQTGNKFDVQWGKLLADKIRKLDDSRYVTNSLNLMLSVMDRMDQIMAEMNLDADAAGGNTEINSLMSNLGAMMGAMVSTPTAVKAVEEAFAQVDICGYNYAECRYEPDHESYPNRVMVGSETYPKDLDKNWELVEKHPYVIGDFSWTAWDYLGEAGIGKVTYGKKQGMNFYAEYPYKAGYCGDMNLIGDRRPVSYWREIIWGLRSKPYICVQPPKYYGVERGMTDWAMTDAVRTWNFKGYEGKPVIVEVYANGDEAELILNGQLVEKKTIGTEKKAQVLFDTVYTPGTLKVVVYKNGEAVGTDDIATAGEDVEMSLYADTDIVSADETDIAYVDLALTDSEGRLNTDAALPVTVSIDGAGVIAGFGSADPESEENYFDMTAKAYEGRLRAAIRGNGETGTIRVTFTAEGCKDAVICLEAK